MRNILLVVSLLLISGVALSNYNIYSSATLARQGGFTVCPPPDGWAMSVWTGANDTNIRDAILSCTEAPIIAAYWLDDLAQAWLAFDYEAPEVLNSLRTVDNLQPIFLYGQSELAMGTIGVVGSNGNAIPLTVEIPRTRRAMGRGLMERESLPEDSGMLFILGDSGGSFWMKDTFIPPLHRLHHQKRRNPGYSGHGTA